MSLSIPAMVLGMDINGLGVVRSLTRSGIRVFGGFRSEFEVGRFSRGCHPIRVPDGSCPGELLESLQRFRQRHGPAVLFPTSDLYVDALIEHRDVLGRSGFVFPVPDAPLAGMLQSKRGQTALATARGLPIPMTRILQSISEIDAMTREVPLPWLVKPLVVGDNTLPRRSKNLVVPTAQELRDLVSAYPGMLGHVVVQEIVPGGDSHICYSMMYFNRQGQPLVWFSARKIRQFPPDYGITSCAISSAERQMTAIASGFLQDIGYKGLVDIEFIYDGQAKTYKFIELNMRSHWANAHALACGVNLFSVAYNDLLGIVPPNSRRPSRREGVVWTNLLQDAVSCHRKRKKGEITVTRWLRDVARSRSFAVFDVRDILPFFIDLTVLFGKAVIRLAIGKRGTAR